MALILALISFCLKLPDLLPSSLDLPLSLAFCSHHLLAEVTNTGFL